MEMDHSCCTCTSCTCEIPKDVDITEWFMATGASESVSDDSMMTTTSTTNQLLLLQNFQQFGWSPVKVHVSADFDHLNGHLAWKEKIMNLFQQEFLGKITTMSSSFLRGGLTFRTSESGNPQIVEPKQSWEFKPSNHLLLLHEEEEADPMISMIAQPMKEWSHLLKKVADSVRRALALPQILVVVAPDDELVDLSRGGSSSGSVVDIDVLRAFYYDTVEMNHQSSSLNIMGSSPHTDWGSFTVVYQDTVGGLQTFCRTCNAWIDVLPSRPPATDFVEFVVHMGDLTSLAVGHALQPDCSSSHNEEPRPSVVFPSPLHRVLSPTSERRVSLVYFAYPAADATINDIIQSLRLNWRYYPSSLPRITPRYDDYFLLRNQQGEVDDAESRHKSALDQFELIRNKPLGSVLEDKWKQVQRG